MAQVRIRALAVGANRNIPPRYMDALDTDAFAVTMSVDEFAVFESFLPTHML